MRESFLSSALEHVLGRIRATEAQLRSKAVYGVLALSIIGLSQIAIAQPPLELAGVVKDTAGIVMPEVTVQATNQASGKTLRTATDNSGRYRFEDIVPGSWNVSFSGNGFDTSDKTVQLDKQSVAFNVTLATSALAAAQGGQQMPPMSGMPGMAQPSAEPVPQTDEGLTEAQMSDPRAVFAYIRGLEQRIRDLESNTVLSEPETRVRRVEVYVDENSNEYDHPVPGARPVVTYQRERVYRRQTINEKIEEAFADYADKSVMVGVSAAIMPQGSFQAEGPTGPAAKKAYYLGSADLFFTARVAQYTTFFADIVGLTGPTPDAEIQGLTLLNSYTARLVTQNQVNVREAWLRTELFRQSLVITAGRLDLANYFDRNAVANDETSQFLSDALVNNPVLGLASNGVGVSVAYDSKRTFTARAAFQQNNPQGPNLNSSIISFAEIGYFLRPPGLQGGNYRLWVRTDNTVGGHKNATGLSFDQKITDNFSLFGRFGYGYVSNAVQDGNMLFYSGGFQLQKRLVFFPGDTWGIGFAQTNLTSGLARESLAEWYYDFLLTERLRLSPRIQFVRELRVGAPTTTYLLPGMRLQAAF